MLRVLELFLFVGAFVATATMIGCWIDYRRLLKAIEELESELTPEELEEVSKGE